MIRMLCSFWRGLRARADDADAAWLARPVDQDDEDAWLRLAARWSHPSSVAEEPTPVERLETGKADHRAALHVVPDVEVADRSPVPARDAGWCPLCDDEIVAGAKVVHTTRGRLVHLSCPGGGQ